MTRRWTVAAIVGFLGVGAAITAWTLNESAIERSRIEGALRSEAAILARTLVPALAAASAAARELDEIVAWKLLDNARLMARLDRAGELTEPAMWELLEENGLDLILVLDSHGDTLRQVGSDGDSRRGDPRVRAVASGEAEEVILGWTSDEEGGHVEVAAALPGGGAVLVRTDAATAYAFAQRIGVTRLLEETVGVGGVLYLVFSEEPDGSRSASSWDGGEVPPAAPESEVVRAVRDRRAFEVAMDVPMPAGRSGSLRVGLDASPLVSAASSATRRATLVAAILAAFGLAAAAFALVSRARTLERAEGARRLAEVEESRRRSERLAAAGALAAGLAHEVRNPLNAIAMAAQRIGRAHSGEGACREFAGGIRREVESLEEILKGFLDLARPATGPRRSEDLAALVREVVSLMEMEASGGDRTLQAHTGSVVLRAVIDREAIRRALINLVRNGLQATEEGGAVTIALERNGNRARIRVTDQGKGIDPAIAGQIFDPFVTSRAEGTGLGLALVRRVAEEHGGSVSLEDLPGGGAEAILQIDLGEVSG